MARQAELLPVADAQARVARAFRRLDPETLALGDALGRVLAAPIQATFDLPPFANSSMDGFALHSESSAGAGESNPVTLPVVGRVAAGEALERAIGAGESSRIMTGAPLPPGADAVVPFENVEQRDGTIILRKSVAAGASVRPAGQDVRVGAPALTEGTELGAPQIALLAALGESTVSVVRKPVVAILATGNELVRPGDPLRPGQIYNSNTPMLVAAVREAGGEPREIDVASDDKQALREALASASGCDLLLTSGGASVGDFDYVKDVIAEHGDVEFWRIRLRPGKPLFFGRLPGYRVLGLPGNPTSSMVTYELFARPAIRIMLGLPPGRPRILAVVDGRVENRGGRESYVRVRLRHQDGRFYASPAGPQDSAMIVPLAAADGLLVAPHDRSELLPGELAEVVVWRLPLD